MRLKPKVVFVQVPPTPLLYVVAIYCFLTKSVYICDCHNGMIYGKCWNKWPFAKRLMRKSALCLVHNADVKRLADNIDIETYVLRDLLPKFADGNATGVLEQFQLKHSDYVLAPFSIAHDEPLEELFKAIALLPETQFVMTWFSERIPNKLRSLIPDNLMFTGYLEEADFNSILVNAGVVLVLSTRDGTQPSGASEAIAAHVPLVISDLSTIRSLYGDAITYVENTPESIAVGIKSVYENPDSHKNQMSILREKLDLELKSELLPVKQLIDKITG